MKKILLPVVAALIGYAAGFLRSPVQTKPAPVAQSAPIAPQQEPLESNASQAVSSFVATGDFRQFAKIGPLFAKLSAAEIGALLDRISRFPNGEADTLLPMLVGAWTRRSPDDAFAWMKPRLGDFALDQTFAMMFATPETNLAGAWADADPTRAIEYARQNPKTSLAGKLLNDAIQSLKGKSDAEKFELLRDFPVGDARDKALRSLCNSWAYSDPLAALSAAESLSAGYARESAIAEVLVNLVRKDRTAAFEKLNAIGLRDPKLEAAMMESFAKELPAEAAAWLEKSGYKFCAATRGEVASRWAEKSPKAGLEWALAQGISIIAHPSDFPEEGARSTYRSWYFGNAPAPLVAAFDKSPDATLEWLKSQPPGEQRDSYFSFLAMRTNSPKTLLPMLSELPPDAASQVAASIAGRGPEAAALEFAKSLSGELRATAFRNMPYNSEVSIAAPGPDRDAMLDGMAFRQSRTAPAKALEAAAKISDPALRRQTFDDVMWSITRGNISYGKGSYNSGPKQSLRAEAYDWLEKSDIPADWKAPWINARPPAP